MANALVKPDLIRWAVERSGIAPSVLQESFPHLLEWMSGERLPSIRQLSELAKRTLTPLGYLFLREPPAEPAVVTQFRTKSGEPPRSLSPELEYTLKEWKGRQEWYREQLIQEGADPLPYVGKLSTQNSVDLAVATIREVIKVSVQWATSSRYVDNLAFLRRRVEDSGMMVASNGVVGVNTRRPLNPLEFRGFVLLDEYAPVIFINAADVPSAQIFTLMHAVVRVFIGSEGILDESELLPKQSVVEDYCNAVATEFLVPAQLFFDAWNGLRRSKTPFDTGARAFGVSDYVIARRAHSLKLIDNSEFFQFYSERLRPVDSGRSGGEYYRTSRVRLGRRFSRAVRDALEDNRITYVQAHRLTGLRGDVFRKFCSELDD